MRLYQHNGFHPLHCCFQGGAGARLYPTPHSLNGNGVQPLFPCHHQLFKPLAFLSNVALFNFSINHYFGVVPPDYFLNQDAACLLFKLRMPMDKGIPSAKRFHEIPMHPFFDHLLHDTAKPFHKHTFDLAFKQKRQWKFGIRHGHFRRHQLTQFLVFVFFLVFVLAQHIAIDVLPRRFQCVCMLQRRNQLFGVVFTPFRRTSNGARRWPWVVRGGGVVCQTVQWGRPCTFLLQFFFSVKRGTVREI